MSFSSLLVYADPAASNDACFRVAGDLAARFQARAIGVSAGDITSGLYFSEGAYAADLLEQERTALQARMADAERAFRQALDGRAKALEWRSALDLPAAFVARQGRAADLIVVGSHPDGDMLDPMVRLNPGELLLRAGRPVLVVPSDCNGLKAKNILVGWKDTREARRAIRDALPLLKLADEVHVVQVLETADDKSEVRSALDDVTAWLLVHGIKAAAMTPAATGKKGQLDAIAAERGSDLIVAGGYGHTRLREWIWGGMTLDLLTRTKCCSLLSH